VAAGAVYGVAGAAEAGAVEAEAEDDEAAAEDDEAAVGGGEGVGAAAYEDARTPRNRAGRLPKHPIPCFPKRRPVVGRQ
jgi:hypothetical protein